jgi:hypothetical protein
MSLYEEPDDLALLAERLRAGRPAPSATLHRRVHDAILAAPPNDGLDPRRVSTLIAAYAGAGTLLLATGASITFL